MARLRVRNTFNFLLGLCVLSLVSMIIGWHYIANIQVISAHKQASARENAVHGGAEVVPALADIQAEPDLLNQNETNLRTPAEPEARAMWLAEQAKRQQTLRRACERRVDSGQVRTNISQLIESGRRGFWFIIVDDQYRLLYTWIAKVGSTNWMSAFLVLKGKYKRVEDVPLEKIGKSNLVKLSSLPGEGIKQRLENYTHFIFVRHPFVRLLSAYRNKLVEKNYYYPKHTGARIIRDYRKNASKEALETGLGVTFYEFVQYLINTRDSKLDHHWRPMYKMVLPCTMRFDFIGKLETGEEDANHILRETRLDHLVHFKKTTHKSVNQTGQTFNHFYSQIPRDDLVRLYRKYEPDFHLFGYEVPDSMRAIIGGT